MSVSSVSFGGAEWRKSSHSGNGTNGDCVEVAVVPRAFGVRDSKSPATAPLTFPDSAWRAFTASLTG